MVRPIAKSPFSILAAAARTLPRSNSRKYAGVSSADGKHASGGTKRRRRLTKALAQWWFWGRSVGGRIGEPERVIEDFVKSFFFSHGRPEAKPTGTASRSTTR